MIPYCRLALGPADRNANRLGFRPPRPKHESRLGIALAEEGDHCTGS